MSEASYPLSIVAMRGAVEIMQAASPRTPSAPSAPSPPSPQPHTTLGYPPQQPQPANGQAPGQETLSGDLIVYADYDLPPLRLAVRQQVVD